MRKLVKYFLLPVIVFILLTCKKKTSIKVTVYNYALAEPIANATVALVEKKGDSGGIFGGSASCKEIASATTDSNGECSFGNEKLRSRSSCDYFLGVTNAYGIPDTYPCGGKASGFLIKGKSQETILNASYYDGFIKVQYNNLLNPSQAGDSLMVSIYTVPYSVPGEPYPFGGGGVLSSVNTQSSYGYPYPISFNTDPVKTQGCKHVIDIRKRKMGIVSKSLDTLKIYPNQTTVIPINW